MAISIKTKLSNPWRDLFVSLRRKFHSLKLLKIVVTRNPAKETVNPSLVSSHAPPKSSSSISWKLEK